MLMLMTYSWHHVQESLLVCWMDHMECWWLNLDQPCARQAHWKSLWPLEMSLALEIMTAFTYNRPAAPYRGWGSWRELCFCWGRVSMTLDFIRIPVLPMPGVALTKMNLLLTCCLFPGWLPGSSATSSLWPTNLSPLPKSWLGDSWS